MSKNDQPPDSSEPAADSNEPRTLESYTGDHAEPQAISPSPVLEQIVLLTCEDADTLDGRITGMGISQRARNMTPTATSTLLLLGSVEVAINPNAKRLSETEEFQTIVSDFAAIGIAFPQILVRAGFYYLPTEDKTLNDRTLKLLYYLIVGTISPNLIAHLKFLQNNPNFKVEPQLQSTLGELAFTEAKNYHEAMRRRKPETSSINLKNTLLGLEALQVTANRQAEHYKTKAVTLTETESNNRADEIWEEIQMGNFVLRAVMGRVRESVNATTELQRPETPFPPRNRGGQAAPSSMGHPGPTPRSAVAGENFQIFVGQPENAAVKIEPMRRRLAVTFEAVRLPGESGEFQAENIRLLMNSAGQNNDVGFAFASLHAEGIELRPFLVQLGFEAISQHNQLTLVELKTLFFRALTEYIFWLLRNRENGLRIQAPKNLIANNPVPSPLLGEEHKIDLLTRKQSRTLQNDPDKIERLDFYKGNASNSFDRYLETLRVERRAVLAQIFHWLLFAGQ